IIMLFKDIPILDPLLSIGITFYILYHVIKNLKETLGILLDKVPKGINTNILEEKIRGISSIEGLHHLHIWSIDG
ncbi:cation transporter, partial [Escherichia coli]|nr:cation transporter [Escherichia coli]